MPQNSFLGRLKACLFEPIMVYHSYRTSRLDGSTATEPLLSATRGDPASSSVRRRVETARREEIRMREGCPPSTGVPLGYLERDGSPPVKRQRVCPFRRYLVSS